MDGQRTRRITDLETNAGLLRDRSNHLRSIFESDLADLETRANAQKQRASVDAELKAVEAELRRLQAEAGS